jgi:hypothetical protein
VSGILLLLLTTTKNKVKSISSYAYIISNPTEMISFKLGVGHLHETSLNGLDFCPYRLTEINLKSILKAARRTKPTQRAKHLHTIRQTCVSKLPDGVSSSPMVTQPLTDTKQYLR